MPSLSHPKAFENDPALLLWTMAAGVSSAVVAFGRFPQWRPTKQALGRTLVSTADAPLVYAAVAVFAVVAFIGLFHRLHTLKVLFRRGVELSGRITSLRLRRHGGRATCVYEFQGTQYRTRVALHHTSESSALSEGALVFLLVDAARPRRAIIRSLYIVDA